MSAKNITLQEALTNFVNRKMVDLHTSMPGKISKFDTATQTADVELLVNSRFENEAGQFVDEAFPLLVSCPVLFPAAGNFRITFPVAVGDSVLVVFSETDLKLWRETGMTQEGSEFRFHISDGVCLLGLHDSLTNHTGFLNAKMTIGKNGSTQVTIGEGAIRLGEDGASESVVLGDKYRGAEDQLMTSFQSNFATAQAAASAAAIALNIGVAALPVAGTAPTPGPTAIASQAVFFALAASMNSIASALGLIQADITAFKLRGAEYLSQIVKTK